MLLIFHFYFTSKQFGPTFHTCGWASAETIACLSIVYRKEHSTKIERRMLVWNKRKIWFVHDITESCDIDDIVTRHATTRSFETCQEVLQIATIFLLSEPCHIEVRDFETPHYSPKTLHIVVKLCSRSLPQHFTFAICNITLTYRWKQNFQREDVVRQKKNENSVSHIFDFFSSTFGRGLSNIFSESFWYPLGESLAVSWLQEYVWNFPKNFYISLNFF